MLSNFILKATFIFCFFLQSFSASSKVTDTIAFWHIDFNDLTILELHQGMEGFVLMVNKDTLNDLDLLGIKYSPGCLVCADCVSHIGIYNQNNKPIQHEDAKGPWTPIIINFRQLLIANDVTGETIFDCYYLEGNKFDPARSVHLIRIQFV